MALESLRKACASDEVREMIELRMKAKRDEASRLEHARREVLEEGLEMGLVKGHQEGLEMGLAKGHQEGLLDVARKMREAGFSPDSISAMTGLRSEDLEA